MRKDVSLSPSSDDASEIGARRSFDTASAQRTTGVGKIRGRRSPSPSRIIRQCLSDSRELPPVRPGNHRGDVHASDHGHHSSRHGPCLRESACVSSKQTSSQRFSYRNSYPCRSRSRSSLARRRLTPQRCRELSRRVATETKVQRRRVRSSSPAALLDVHHRRRVDQSSSASDDTDHLAPQHPHGRVKTRRCPSESIAVTAERRRRSPKRGHCSISHANPGKRIKDSQMPSAALCISRSADEAATPTALACLHSLSQEVASFQDANTSHMMQRFANLPCVSSDSLHQRSSLDSSSAHARTDAGNREAFDSVGLIKGLTCLVSMLIPRSHTQATFITPSVSCQ